MTKSVSSSDYLISKQYFLRNLVYRHDKTNLNLSVIKRNPGESSLGRSALVSRLAPRPWTPRNWRFSDGLTLRRQHHHSPFPPLSSTRTTSRRPSSLQTFAFHLFFWRSLSTTIIKLAGRAVNQQSIPFVDWACPAWSSFVPFQLRWGGSDGMMSLTKTRIFSLQIPHD